MKQKTMNKKKMSKRQKDIKSKLMAAICMLLVSSIMMVSTTYAWFTLSTAPEVTGITTAVGANGNLEMALLPTDALTKGAAQDYGITSQAGDSMAHQDETLANVTWGNLVDLKDESYGLSQITLYPAALNAELTDTEKNPTQLGAAFLQIPSYGADGRVSELLSNTVTGVFAGNSFAPDDSMGVRAVGTASGMTARQLAYRNAQQTASSATSQANTNATLSLQMRGSKLASIAIKHATTTDGSDTYGKADVEALRGMIDDLQGNADTTGILQYIEKAYIQYILAYVASASGADSDEAVSVFQGVANAEGATIETVTAALSDAGASLPDTVSDYVAKLAETKESVSSASTALATLETTLSSNADATFSWEEIQDAMAPLVTTSALTVNGYKVSEITSDITGFANKVLNDGGATVTMTTGAGVYADIADHADDYFAKIKIEEVKYGTVNLTNLDARMETESTVNPHYLSLLSAIVANAGAPVSDNSDGAVPITDMYGYVIDLAFRTNASQSDLMLQTEAMDRIYGTEGTEETMGKGSTMTFTATTAEFTSDQVKELMSAIRIVFFEPEEKSVMATAKLDMTKATVGADGVTVSAPIKLYKNTAGGETVTKYEPAAENQNATHIWDATTSQYREPNTGETATHVAVTTTTTAGETWLEADKAVITALNQGQAHAVSALVYLDGEHIGNDDVAATAATSATGTMNLQFASSATLVPMNYTPLMKQDGTTTESSTPASSESADPSEESQGA